MTQKIASVKVFGERNTGTNAFAKLIRRNSTTDVLPTQIGELPGITPLIGRALSRFASGRMREAITDQVFARASVVNKWKHRATYFTEAELDQLAHIPTFIMLRHPASWLVGLRRRPYHALQSTPKDLAEFLQRDWQTVGREGLERNSFTPTGLYNEKLRSYLWYEAQIHKRGGIVEFVRFEDFVIDQLAVFNQISIHLANPDPKPRIIASSTKKSGQNADDYARYYRDQVWAGQIDEKAQNIIKSRIDWESVSRFYRGDDWRDMGPA